MIWSQRLGIAIGLATGVALTLVMFALLRVSDEEKATQPSGANATYTGRLGDRFRVPVAAAECQVFAEGGFPTLYCSHKPTARYQVYFYKDRLQVWRNGNPDGPVFSARP